MAKKSRELHHRSFLIDIRKKLYEIDLELKQSLVEIEEDKFTRSAINGLVSEILLMSPVCSSIKLSVVKWVTTLDGAEKRHESGG